MAGSRWLLLSCVLLGFLVSPWLSSLADAGEPHRPTQDAVPRFVDAPCRFPVGEGFKAGHNLRCGMLLVPEDHRAPNGRQIELAVAVFRTPSPHRRPDPVVFLQGGPGAPIVGQLGSEIDSATAPYYLGDHDLVLIDQRGTGLSRPVLSCPGYDRAAVKAAALPPVQELSIAAQALRVCRRTLIRKRIDLAAYGTPNDAADIADLRTALALPRLNLYGVSYGSHLALEVMRYYPDAVRSVVLDSVVPPWRNAFVGGPYAEAHAFRVLLQGCARSRRCRRRYPYLKQTFTDVLASLDRHPVRVHVSDAGIGSHVIITVTGYVFAATVQALMYYGPAVPYLRTLILHTSEHRYRDLRRAVGATLYLGSPLSLGVYETTICSEGYARTTRQALLRAAHALPQPLQHDLQVAEAGALERCRIWDVPPADPMSLAPVRSAIPTLLLSGEYDPVTPPVYATRVSRTLSRSVNLVFPGLGHAVGLASNCARRIMQAFYDDPTVHPPTACIARMREHV